MAVGPAPRADAPGALEARLQQVQEEEQAIHLAVDPGHCRARRVRRGEPAAAREGRREEVEGKAAERVQRALKELEEARSALVESRRLRLWTELFPAQEVGREPRWLQLGGGETHPREGRP